MQRILFKIIWKKKVCKTFYKKTLGRDMWFMTVFSKPSCSIYFITLLLFPSNFTLNINMIDDI